MEVLRPRPVSSNVVVAVFVRLLFSVRAVGGEREWILTKTVSCLSCHLSCQRLTVLREKSLWDSQLNSCEMLTKFSHIIMILKVSRRCNFMSLRYCIFFHH